MSNKAHGNGCVKIDDVLIQNKTSFQEVGGRLDMRRNTSVYATYLADSAVIRAAYNQRAKQNSQRQLSPAGFQLHT